MTKAFTQNDILRYLYNETSVIEKVEIQKELFLNSELREFYIEMKDLVTSLANLEIKAPQSAVDNILEYSKRHNLQFHQ